jgi:ribosomal protein L40E
MFIRLFNLIANCKSSYFRNPANAIKCRKCEALLRVCKIDFRLIGRSGETLAAISSRAWGGNLAEKQHETGVGFA